MSCYVTLQDVKDQGILLPEDIDVIETRYPGKTLRVATTISGDVRDQLRKRYKVEEFRAPYPDPLVRWTSILTTCHLLVFVRGPNPESAQLEEANRERDKVEARIKDAVDSEKGLTELAAYEREPPAGSAVSVGGPLGYSEASPYASVNRQAERVRSEGW